MVGLMLDGKYRSVPVVDDDRLVEIVSRRDALASVRPRRADDDHAPRSSQVCRADRVLPCSAAAHRASWTSSQQKNPNSMSNQPVKATMNTATRMSVAFVNVASCRVMSR